MDYKNKPGETRESVEAQQGVQVKRGWLRAKIAGLFGGGGETKDGTSPELQALRDTKADISLPELVRLKTGPDPDELADDPDEQIVIREQLEDHLRDNASFMLEGIVTAETLDALDRSSLDTYVAQLNAAVRAGLEALPAELRPAREEMGPYCRWIMQCLANVEPVSPNAFIQRFGDRAYRVTGALGKGGFARVFRVIDGRGREHAMKYLIGLPEADRYAVDRELAVLRATGALVEEEERIEARTAAAQADDSVFVTELIRGRSLESILKQNETEGTPLAFDAALQIGRSSARAIAGLHEHGFLHLDVKPANIQWSPKEGARPLDFGNSLPIDGTDGEQVAVSPKDSAPELLLRQEGGTETFVGPSADVYSLGVTLKRLVTGKDVMAGTITANYSGAAAGMQLLIRKAWREMHDDPSRRYAFRQRVIAEVVAAMGEHPRTAPCAELIADMLDFDPDRRPTMEEVMARLERLSDQDLPA